jgi:multiple sugar transport system permease protein
MENARRWQRRGTPYLYVAPAILLLVAVVFYPLAYAFLLTFQHFKLTGEIPRFAGFENYVRLVQDPLVGVSLLNSLVFAGGLVSLCFILATIVALILNESFVGRRLVRALMLVPWAVSGIVNGLMWKGMYSPSFGVVNDLLVNKLHILKHYVNWLQDLPMLSLILAQSWKMMPFIALLLLAGLQSISQDLYEAATIDGAGYLRKFYSITMPSLRSVALVAIVILTIDSLKVFAIVDVLTKGGPANMTLVLDYYVYKAAFNYLEMGYGSTLAFLLTSVILVFVVFYRKLMTRSS